ncbi:MAG TPA: SWIM zinc finger family protein [Anaerolineae bacterium]|nr:SWIM zinc finger family protein [Anaerolineae bacterium]
MSWDWGWYPKPKPRRPANGIKAQSKQFGKTWWASKWLSALERLVDPGRLSRGRSYARSGQVLNLDVKPGRVDSRVQGSRPKPYTVRIDIKPLADKEWEKVADAMAAQAIFAAKLLAGEMPQDIEDAFKSAKVNLFPTSRGDLETDCSCPDWSNPCKHIAAVYYLLGEQFDADPFLLFRLRGKSKDNIMAMLRARRSADAEPAASASAPTAARKRAKAKRREKPIPLEAGLDRFWEAGASLEDLRVTIAAPPIDAAPIKRLGAPGFWNNKTDFTTIFVTAYQSITQASLAAALGDEDPRSTGQL